MRTATRAGLALVGAVVLAGTTATAASAATDATTATVAVTAGALSISVPDSTTLSDAAPGGVATGTLADITVSDLTADELGWTADVTVTAFTSGDETLPASGFTYDTGSAVTTGTTTVTPTDTGATGVVQQATAVRGNNTAEWDAALSLQIPADALAASSYTATITHSVL